MNTLLGCLLLVSTSTIAGGLVGAFIGVFLTAINNLIVVKWFDAATGSYSYWIKFFTLAGALAALAGSIIWCSSLVLKAN